MKPPGSPGGFFVFRSSHSGCPCPMPLPPAPSKRAALLPAEAYDAPARSSHKAARKTEAPGAESLQAERPQATDEFDLRPGVEPVQPVAFHEDGTAERPAARRRAASVAANEAAPRKKRSNGP